MPFLRSPSYCLSFLMLDPWSLAMSRIYPMPGQLRAGEHRPRPYRQGGGLGAGRVLCLKSALGPRADSRA
jgi:hypothetical protein